MNLGIVAVKDMNNGRSITGRLSGQTNVDRL
jgi:hypothetical protein